MKLDLHYSYIPPRPRSMNAPVMVELNGETDPLEVRVVHGYMGMWALQLCIMVVGKGSNIVAMCLPDLI